MYSGNTTKGGERGEEEMPVVVEYGGRRGREQ